MRCRVIFLVPILQVLVPSLHALSVVGVVSYFEGKVAVARNGSYLSPEDVVIGLEVGSFDTVETGADGYVELQMNSPVSGSRVRVGPNSTFYFENTQRTPKASRMVFQLLRGSLFLKVGKLLRLDSYSVQTDHAAMTVRGTDFSVEISKDRSTLVSVSEGIVRSEVLGKSVFVEPGVVALVDQNARLSTEIVSEADLEMYRQSWHRQRLEALRINAALSIEHYSRLWDQQLPRLQRAMADLESHIEVFHRWADLIDSSERVSLSEVIRDKMTLSKGMLALRAILPVVERTYYTLLDLKDVYEQGYAEGRFSAGQYRDAADFYASFQIHEMEMQGILSRARWMVEIYRVLSSEETISPNSNIPTPSFIPR